MSIPSSSPVYTPIKRLKRDVKDLEATRLFTQEWYTARSEPEFESEFEPEFRHIERELDASKEVGTKVGAKLGAKLEAEAEGKPEPKEIPNSQWWETSLEAPNEPDSSTEVAVDSSPDLGPPSLGPDDSISDTDDDVGDTQFYLRQILTESMVESLPLPPQQKVQAREILHES